MSRSEMVHCDHSYGPDGMCGRSAPVRSAVGWDLGWELNREGRDLCPVHAPIRIIPTPGEILPRAYRGLITPFPTTEEP